MSEQALKNAAEPVLMGLQELSERAGEGRALEVKEKPRKAHPAAFQKGRPPGPGRPKGVPNKVTTTIREAIEIAAQQCHPSGFAGWLVERAQGGIEDRKIFAGVVGRVVPLQVQAKSEGVMRIELGWLNGRDVGRHLSQPLPIAAQVIDLQADSDGALRIKDQSDASPSQPAGEGEQG